MAHVYIGCDRVLLDACAGAGQPYVRLNPLHAWHFARSLNLPKADLPKTVLPKTDRPKTDWPKTDWVDARMLARFGAERQPAPHLPRDPERVALAALVGRRDQLKGMATQEKNRLGKAVSPMNRADIRASFQSLAGRIARVHAEIAAQIDRSPDLARDAKLLRSIP